MNNDGWIFLITFWTLLIGITAWSYSVLLSEPHIPEGYMGTEEHPADGG